MHYWGLDAIAKRLDVKPGSILRMYETQGLPLLSVDMGCTRGSCGTPASHS